MTTLYTQDATPTNPFGIGYHEQMVDISKRLIREREAKEAELLPLVNGEFSFGRVRAARNAVRALEADPNADPAALAAARSTAETLASRRSELNEQLEQNNRLLQQTRDGLVQNEDRLAQARAKAASQPANRPIVNAGADPAAQTPTTPTNLTGAVPPEQPLNVTTPAANQATAVPTSGDEALQATEDAQAAALAAQEGRAFAPTPVAAPAAPGAAPAPAPVTAQPAAVDAGGNAVGIALQDETGATSTLRRNPETGELYNPGTIPLPENVQTFAPPPVPPADTGYGGGTSAEQTAINQALAAERNDAAAVDAAAAAATKAKLAQAQAQSTIQQRFNQTSQGDWRVRLSLATGSDYLYNSNDPGILKALRATNGIIFPYTPSIQTNYTANYDKYELTHSNHRGYFYKNSQVGDIQITGAFTAQDTAEAEYLLAVIHFFRSVTKMFYGQDEQRGAPPPLCYLDGLGQYQFNNHPVLVSSFQYNLPQDVDYIRVDPNNQGLSLAARQPLVSSSPGSTLSSVINRLKNAGLPSGANPGGPVDLGNVQQKVSGTGQTTYVPTKIEISITLLPINTRSQVSQQFSLNRFANGDLLKQGFW
jgi:hypothetical protein